MQLSSGKSTLSSWLPSASLLSYQDWPPEHHHHHHHHHHLDLHCRRVSVWHHLADATTSVLKQLKPWHSVQECFFESGFYLLLKSWWSWWWWFATLSRNVSLNQVLLGICPCWWWYIWLKMRRVSLNQVSTFTCHMVMMISWKGLPISWWSSSSWSWLKWCRGTPAWCCDWLRFLWVEGASIFWVWQRAN